MGMIDEVPGGGGTGVALPHDLEHRLTAFRGLVWRVKLVEAACGALCGTAVAYLLVVALDRVIDTPGSIRLAAFGAAVAAAALVPLAVHRWVWCHRGLDQVARLLARRFPSLGDQLLGIIEIVRGDAAGQTRSRALCEAAVAQVAEMSRGYDFRQAVPPSRQLVWGVLAAVPVAAAVAVAVLAPDAAANAWARFLTPWRAIERFTFTRIDPLPDRLVVPHGEATPLVVALRETSRWRPQRGTARVGGQRLWAPLEEGRYTFTVPPQLAASTMAVAVGDERRRMRIEPMFRPEITALEAEIVLPAYLERAGALTQDARGGTLAPVKGSTVSLSATANRALSSAHVDGTPVTPAGSVVRTPPRTVDEQTRLTLAWRDEHGLDGQAPIEVAVVPRADEPPVVATADAPATRSVLLNTDTLRFKVAARDDFGIRRVGLEWRGLSDSGTAGGDAAAAETGDRLLQTGGGDVESLDVAATFCPDALGIQPQPIALVAFAEDFLPGRGRSYSAPLVLYVVDKAEHALLLNAQMQQFRQRVNEVRDREMALLAANKEFRGLPPERLLDPATQAGLEAQAAAEQANARRLDRLVDEGTQLVREAAKNPEFDAPTLEELSADILTLADISEQRMPGVADLLRKAATAPSTGTPATGERGSDTKANAGGMAAKPGAEQAPKVGDDKSQGGRPGGEAEGQAAPPVPRVVDKESSQQPPSEGEAAAKKSSGGGAGRLGLPVTQAGPPPPGGGGEPAEQSPAQDAIDGAIAAQEELLAEFAKVADELAAVMARLEGSTFVKRLKLAAREQGAIGSRIAGMTAEAFGTAERQPPGVTRALGEVRELNARETDKVSALMDDLQAYFDRRQLPAFRTVLEEMKHLDTLGSLRQLSDDIVKEAGMSIAQSEFWSDTFDRLADDLVPPPQKGPKSPGGPPSASVPPEVVLEAMKILEEEMNLREETRVAQQTRAALPADAVAKRGGDLSGRQHVLADRVAGLVDRLLDEPDGESAFGREIQLFEQVEEVMAEAADILGTADTGPRAIAAESEAIELLLAAQAACSGGGGGGGGGATPGGGSTGTASSLALALAGRGNRAAREVGGGEKEQATGTTGRVLPEEFRAGLDAYFNRLEKERRP